MRQTSIDCFHRIKETGILNGLKLQVYSCLFENGAMTQGECLEYFKSQTQNTGSINTRFSELKRMGAIRETQVRPCKITGVMCYEWDLTDELPKKDVRKETNREKSERLEKENAILKVQIESLKANLYKKSFGQGFLFQDTQIGQST